MFVGYTKSVIAADLFESAHRFILSSHNQFTRLQHLKFQRKQLQKFSLNTYICTSDGLFVVQTLLCHAKVALS